MATVSTDFKRGFLRLLKWDADKATPPVELYDALMLASSARFNETKQGRFLTSTAGNGRVVTFTVPNGFNPQTAAELCSEMLDRYDTAEAALIRDGTAEPEDGAIFTEMLAMLQPVTEAYSDYSGVER